LKPICAYHHSGPECSPEDARVSKSATRHTNDSTKQAKGGRPWLAYLLFLFAIGLFAAAGWMYLRENDPPIAVPTAEAGHNEMKDVMLAFENAGLNAEYGRTADRALGLTEVAQNIVVDGTPVYIFIYPDADQRIRDQERLDPTALQIVNTRGTPTAQGTPHVSGGSNVLIVTYNTDPEFTESLDAAVTTLP
jgi:hypothetical protein